MIFSNKANSIKPVLRVSVSRGHITHCALQQLVFSINIWEGQGRWWRKYGEYRRGVLANDNKILVILSRALKIMFLPFAMWLSSFQSKAAKTSSQEEEAVRWFSFPFQCRTAIS